MSSNSHRLLAALALAAVAGHAQAGASACPATQSKARLATVNVFDGPPEQRADLMPDSVHRTRHGSRSEWSVAYVFAAGRQLHVQCDYGPKVAPVVIEPGPQTTACSFVTRGKAGKTFSCTPRGE